jgi:hypothetical protein
MSADSPKSGIVLFPVGSEIAHMSLPSSGPGGEEAFQTSMNMVYTDVQPNIARQLGAATNAYCEGGEVQLGTAIAIPYSAGAAFEIDKLRHDEATGFLRVHGDAKPILAQEQVLLDELTQGVYRELQELGLAKDGLFAALEGRRIDLIAPAAIGRGDGLAVAARELLTQPGDRFDIDVIAARTWLPYRKGGFLQISGSDAPGAHHSARLAEDHPLYAGEQLLRTEESHTRIVRTTAATGSEYISESVIKSDRPTVERSEQQGGAIRRKATATVTTTNEISYLVPRDTPDVTEKLTTNAMEADLAPEWDLSDSGLDAFEASSPAQVLHDQQQAAASKLDPASSFEWACRIR